MGRVGRVSPPFERWDDPHMGGRGCTSSSSATRPRRLHIRLGEPLPYADWMGTRHMSALETSTRDAVFAVVTLSEENGRVTVFRDGDYDNRQRDELVEKR